MGWKEFFPGHQVLGRLDRVGIHPIRIDRVLGFYTL